jgi:hypothetical protein
MEFFLNHKVTIINIWKHWKLSYKIISTTAELGILQPTRLEYVKVAFLMSREENKNEVKLEEPSN